MSVIYLIEKNILYQPTINSNTKCTRGNEEKLNLKSGSIIIPLFHLHPSNTIACHSITHNLINQLCLPYLTAYAKVNTYMDFDSHQVKMSNVEKLNRN